MKNRLENKNSGKISLNAEGILLRCTQAFDGKPKKVTPVNSKGRASYIVPTVEKDDVILFLGCWHYKIKFKPLNDKIDFERDVKTPTWTTSLRFLHGQTIVKVDWYGIDKLDQLLEASKFMYGHFQLVEEE